MPAAARRVLAALALLASAGGASAAEPADKLTPLPPPTAIVQSWTVATPRGADAKPPPVLTQPAPPRPAPPLSPPSQKAGQGAEAAAPPPAAIAAPAAAAPDKATPAPPAAKAAVEPAKPSPEAKPPAKTPPKKAERVIRYASTEINVRPRPSHSARRIDVIDEGTALEVVGPLIDDKWVKVARHGEILGYVVADYLLPHPPKPH